MINNQMDNLAHLVNLYRALGFPKIEEGGYLTSKIESADESLLEIIRHIYSAYAEKFEVLKFDEVDSGEDWDIESYVDSSIYLVFQLPPRLFFSNLKEFVDKSTRLSMGELRDDYYLIEENYFSGDGEESEKIEQLKKICEWIKFLKDVLPHTEERPNWLAFVIFPESKDGNGRGKRAFRSKISFSDIDADLSRSSEFLDIAKKNDLHASERKSVFRQVLAELLDHHSDDTTAFSYLLMNMDKLCQNYHDCYERYINGFSIEKLQKEVLEDYNQFSAKIRAALNEIIAKAFAVPASLAVAALLVRLDSIQSDIVLALVILLTTIITVLLLSWQSNQIKLICHQVSNKFKSFENSGASGEEFARNRESELLASARSVGLRILWLRFLSWIPVILVGFYLWVKYIDV